MRSRVNAPGSHTFESPPQLKATVNPDAFRQALMNLLDNAWKYGGGREGTRIELETLAGVTGLIVCTDVGAAESQN
jgi:signal transduction histidine kinase